MDTPTDLMFAASGRSVMALDRYTGRPVWRIKLPRFFGGSIVTLMASGNEVFVGRGGYVYCLDRASGGALWERGISTSGGGLVMMATDGSGSSDAAAAQAAIAAQAAAAGGASAAVMASAAAS